MNAGPLLERVRNSQEAQAIAAMAGSDDGGLIVLPDAFNTVTKATTFALAAKYRLPAIYPNRPFAADGGLMSYGTDAWLLFRDNAIYIDRILRGANVAVLPVQFATKFELVINLKTAKSLGLTIPETLLATADEVIQ